MNDQGNKSSVKYSSKQTQRLDDHRRLVRTVDENCAFYPEANRVALH